MVWNLSHHFTNWSIENVAKFEPLDLQDRVYPRLCSLHRRCGAYKGRYFLQLGNWPLICDLFPDLISLIVNLWTRKEPQQKKNEKWHLRPGIKFFMWIESQLTSHKRYATNFFFFFFSFCQFKPLFCYCLPKYFKTSALPIFRNPPHKVKGLNPF